MSSPQGRKQRPESYAYSWFLPADGHNGSAIVSQLPPSELEAATSGSDPKVAAMEARTEEWRHSGVKAKQSISKPLNVDLTKFRLIGIVGWSTLAAIGAALVSTRGGPTPGLQLGILGGAWIGISLAIWFVPRILSR
jgi:hypothetical protein